MEAGKKSIVLFKQALINFIGKGLETRSVFCCCCFSSYSHTHTFGSPQARSQIGAVAESYTTAIATQDLSCICYPCNSLWQCQILNPLSKTWDQTHILTETMSGSYHAQIQRELHRSYFPNILQINLLGNLIVFILKGII